MYAKSTLRFLGHFRLAVEAKSLIFEGPEFLRSHSAYLNQT